MKRFVIGDIHGNYKGLLECLEKSKFDYEKDKLIVLGDTCDGLPDVKECFNELLKIKHLIHILGNHDEWAMDWYDREPMYKDNPYVTPESLWTSQGGENTILSYGRKIVDEEDGGWGYNEMDKAHLDLLLNAPLYHIEKIGGKRYVFVHGGLEINQKDMTKQDRNTLLWDRNLAHYARVKHFKNPDYKYGDWDMIFIGHTTTQRYKQTEPLKLCNVVMMDTGAGWDGRLSIMDLESGEYWQSNFVRQMYPLGGRG